MKTKRNSNQKKTYTVFVQDNIRVWDTVEVQASSQEEALEWAEENYQVDWGNSECFDRDSLLLTEDGHPVEWSNEAAAADPKNPYRKKPVDDQGNA